MMIHMKYQGIFSSWIPCACLKLLLNGSVWLEIWLISCIGLLCKMYKGADQTARMHGLSFSLYLHWQTVWTQNGPEYNTANANHNTYHGSLSKATVMGLMDLFQDVWETKPKTQISCPSVSLSLSLSLFPFTTCFHCLQTVWIQKITDTLGIFIYLKRGFSIHVWTCSMFQWIFLQDIISCNLDTYHMWQRLRRACANVYSQYSIQHAAWYTSQQHTMSAQSGPPAKCHPNGGSLAGR